MDKKETKPKNKPVQNGFSDEQQQQINSILASSLNHSSIPTNNLKDIENFKIVVASLLNDENLESLTCLEIGELNDINDAILLNTFYQNDKILFYIEHRLKLLRSVTKDGNNLINVFKEMIKGNSFQSGDETGGISNILGNRFKHG